MSGHIKNTELRAFIRELLEYSYSQSDIAKHCGISRQRVNKIVKEMKEEQNEN